MNLTEFELLCRDASEQLGLQDTKALGLGFPVSFDDVVFEAEHLDGQESFLLLADLGAVAPEDRVSVYERLLSMQLTAWDEPRVRFGFHPMHEAAVLCVGAALGKEANGAWLAALLKSVALQVDAWRKAHFAGKAVARRPASDAFAQR